MRVIIFGVTGGLGQHTWRAAVDAGHEVVAFVRSPHKLDGSDPRFQHIQVVRGDVMDAPAVRAAARGCEVAVNCTSPAGGNGTEEMVRSLVPAAAEAGVQSFYLVGGLGALWVPGSDRGVLLQDWDDPAAMAKHGLPAQIPRDVIRRMTRGHLASMAFLASTGHPHAYLCPGAMLEGPPSGARVVTLDEIGGPAPGRVPFADVAKVLVDDIGHGDLLGHRVCVSPA